MNASKHFSFDTIYDGDVSLLSDGMSPKRLAMDRSALGLHCEEDNESSAALLPLLLPLLLLGRSSARMALAWVSAVGSTGSLISSCTSAGVLGVSMLLLLEVVTVVEKEVIDETMESMRRLLDRRK